MEQEKKKGRRSRGLLRGKKRKKDHSLIQEKKVLMLGCLQNMINFTPPPLNDPKENFFFFSCLPRKGKLTNRSL